MSNRSNPESALDRDLAARFTQMRREDDAEAPPFPTRAQLQARAPGARARPFSGALWKVMAAASVIAVAVLLVNRPFERDPGALYVDIMNANSMATDSLLAVSYSTLPEMAGLPDVFDINTTALGVPNTN